jgi:hypothetical protein
MDNRYRPRSCMVTTHVNSILTKRISGYIANQSTNPPFSALTLAGLIFLTLYLAMLGFFICLLALKWVFPWMIRLGDYATHDAGRVGRILAIVEIVLIWSCCVLWIFAFPLIPGIGGIIARQGS